MDYLPPRNCGKTYFSGGIYCRRRFSLHLYSYWYQRHHLPLFVILDWQSHPAKKVNFVSYRPNNDLAYDNFQTALNNESWDETLVITNPDLILDSLNAKLCGLYNYSFPLTTRKARIYKTKLKPWLSLSLIKSCKKKNKLYKAYLKSKDLGALEKYKKYKNKLTAILHKCEKMYYTNLLEQHKSNLRETWKIIKELLHRQDSNHNVIPLVINGVTIDDPLMIANNFNNYFASIGPNMANNIPTANCHYSNYLKNSSLNSMFIPPATENEITDIISNLKITKPCDSFELPINIIKKMHISFVSL